MKTHVICYDTLSEVKFDGGLHPIMVRQTDFGSIRLVCELLDSLVVDSLRTLHWVGGPHTVEDVVNPLHVSVLLTPPGASEGVGGLTPGGVLGRRQAGLPQVVQQGVSEGLEHGVHVAAGGGVQVSADDDQVGAVSLRVIL